MAVRFEYRCLAFVTHNGRDYEPGDFIWLTVAEGNYAVRQGVVEATDFEFVGGIDHLFQEESS